MICERPYETFPFSLTVSYGVLSQCVCVRVWCWQHPARGRKGVLHTTQGRSLQPEGKGMSMFTWRGLGGARCICVRNKVWKIKMFGCVLVMRS